MTKAKVKTSKSHGTRTGQKTRQRTSGSGRSNPRRSVTPTKKTSRTPRPRQFYTASDDARIIQLLQKVDKNYTKSKVSQDLADELGRTRESIRDRIKRYLGALPSSDQKQISSYIKKAGTYYVHWKGDRGTKRVDHFSTDVPNTHPKRQVKVIKKKVVKTKSLKVKTKDNFDWLKEKLQSSDPYYACDNGVQFLNCLFAELKKHYKVKSSQIHSFVRNSSDCVSLQDVLVHFKI